MSKAVLSLLHIFRHSIVSVKDIPETIAEEAEILQQEPLLGT